MQLISDCTSFLCFIFCPFFFACFLYFVCVAFSVFSTHFSLSSVAKVALESAISQANMRASEAKNDDDDDDDIDDVSPFENALNPLLISFIHPYTILFGLLLGGSKAVRNRSRSSRTGDSRGEVIKCTEVSSLFWPIHSCRRRVAITIHDRITVSRFVLFGSLSLPQQISPVSTSVCI